MERSARGETRHLRELFSGEPPHVTMHSEVRRPMCGERPLLTARVMYPELDLPPDSPACRINTFYADICNRFLNWCSTAGAKYAEREYEGDPDPARRFKHRRYLAYAHFTAGFISPELISVRGEAALLHGTRQISCRATAECWRVRDGAIIPWQKKRPQNEVKYISREGDIISLTASRNGFFESRENVEDSIYDFKTISKLFATIR